MIPLRLTKIVPAASIAAYSFLTAAASPQPVSGITRTDTVSATDTVPADSVAGSFYEDLDELVITASKPLMKSDGAKLTYNVSEDVTAKGTSVIEMLRKVPMVSVDGQDNIRVNGQENFKIYVNGKEDPFLSANYQKVLKAMPAESVSEIEVITDPDAKYDAEGTAGILNFITERKKKDEGYSGSLSANFSSQNAGGSLFAGMKKGNVNANVNFNYATNRIFGQSNSGETMRENLTNELDHKLMESSKTVNKWDFYGGSAAMSWEPNIKNLFTLSVDFNIMAANVPEARGDASMYDINNTRRWSYRRLLTGNLHNNSVAANASYQHDFDTKGHNLILSYRYSFGNSLFDLEERYHDIHDIEMPFRFKWQNSTNYTRENTFQIDYVNPFGNKKHTLEAGGKGLWRHNNAYGLTTGSGDASGNRTKIEDTDIIQFQDIYAAYVSYNGSFGHVSLKAGLRYEHTHMGLKFRKGDMSDFTTNLDDAVPNASITYSFSPMSNLRAAYSMRISRPTVEQTNPYEMQIESNSIRTGNPDLSSEQRHRVSLTYSAFGSNIGGNIGMEYTFTDNSIERFTYLRDNIFYESYANAGHAKRTAVNGFLTWSPLPTLRVNINATASYVDLKSEHLKLSNTGWTINYGGNVNYTLPSDITLSAYGGQQTKNINLQGHSNGWYYYGLGVSKSFFKKAFTVTLNARQFFQARQIYESTISTDMLKVTERFTHRSWDVGINLSWNFGNIGAEVKKASRTIENDDKAETTSRNNMGGI